MTGLAPDDITRMRDQLFFDGPERNRPGLNGLDVRVSLVPASYKPLPR